MLFKQAAKYIVAVSLLCLVGASHGLVSSEFTDNNYHYLSTENADAYGTWEEGSFFTWEQLSALNSLMEMSSFSMKEDSTISDYYSFFRIGDSSSIYILKEVFTSDGEISGLLLNYSEQKMWVIIEDLGIEEKVYSYDTFSCYIPEETEQLRLTIETEDGWIRSITVPVSWEEIEEGEETEEEQENLETEEEEQSGSESIEQPEASLPNGEVATASDLQG